jgi:hypothetical protein
MAHNIASPIATNHPKKIYPKGKRRNTPNTPIDCIGCRGPKKRKELFCKTCRLNYRTAKMRERELDEMFERAIA